MRRNAATVSILVSTPAALCLALAAAELCRADDSATTGDSVTREALAERYRLSPDAIQDGPVPGLYEVVVENRVSYVTTDGRFLFRGEIIDLDTQQNLTEARRADARATVLRNIDPADEIIYSPNDGNVKYRITVFTDVDCGYCRQFHRDIDAVTALGIEVRYVSFPRTGPDTPSWTRAENVWCAADRKAALTQAELGADVPAVPGCDSNPVAEEYQLGHRLGLSGTPGVYSESGYDLGGYLPSAQLLARLEELESRQ